MPAENIFAQFARPVRSVQDYMADYDAQDLRRQQLIGAQRQNALAALTQQQTMRQMADADADRNALSSLAAGWNAQTTPEQRIAGLRNSGRTALMTQADALEKQSIERTKGDAEAKAKQAEVLGKVLTAQGDLAARVMANPTPQAAAAAIANMKAITQALGVQIDFSGDEAALGQFQNQEQIKQWAAGHALKAEQLLPKLQALNAGGQYVNQAVNPITGAVSETGRTDITQSADNRATVGAQIANANATREVAKATRDAANAQRDQASEMKLADDYRAQSKEFMQSKSAHEQLKSTLASATSSPAATLAAATKFMKILDPGSVVRESELGMALAASGVLDRAANYISTLQSGKKLTATQAADFKNVSDQMFVAAQRVQQTIDADYKSKAKQWGLRGDVIVQNLGQDVAMPKDVADALAKHGAK